MFKAQVSEYAFIVKVKKNQYSGNRLRWGCSQSNTKVKIPAGIYLVMDELPLRLILAIKQGNGYVPSAKHSYINIRDIERG